VGGRRPINTRWFFGGVHSDLVEPGVERAVAAERAYGAPRANERFLRDVLALGVASDIARNQPDHLVLVLAYQQVKGSFVPILDTLDQRAIQFIFAHPGRVHRQCRHPLRELV